MIEDQEVYLSEGREKRRSAVLDEMSISGIVAKAPAIFYGISVTGLGGVGSVDLYDGIDATGTLKAKLRSLNNTTFGLCQGGAITFRQGIYVQVNNVTSSVSILYDVAKN